MIEIKIIGKSSNCDLSDEVEVSLWIDGMPYDAVTTAWADVQTAVNGFREYVSGIYHPKNGKPIPSDFAVKVTEAFRESAQAAVDEHIARGEPVCGEVDGVWRDAYMEGIANRTPFGG